MKKNLKSLTAAALTTILLAACNGSESGKANPGDRNAPTQMDTETDTTSTPYMDTTASDTAQ